MADEDLGRYEAVLKAARELVAAEKRRAAAYKKHPYVRVPDDRPWEPAPGHEIRSEASKRVHEARSALDVEVRRAHVMRTATLHKAIADVRRGVSSGVTCGYEAFSRIEKALCEAEEAAEELG